MKISYLWCVLAICLAGCAGNSSSGVSLVETKDEASSSQRVAHSTPQELSPIMYETYDCDQISKEAGLLTLKTESFSGTSQQKQTHKKQASVKNNRKKEIIWPLILEADQGGSQNPELIKIKGQFEALEKAAEREKCSFKFVRNGPKIDQPKVKVAEPKTGKAA